MTDLDFENQLHVKIRRCLHLTGERENTVKRRKLEPLETPEMYLNIKNDLQKTWQNKRENPSLGFSFESIGKVLSK